MPSGYKSADTLDGYYLAKKDRPKSRHPIGQGKEPITITLTSNEITALEEYAKKHGFKGRAPVIADWIKKYCMHDMAILS